MAINYFRHLFCRQSHNSLDLTQIRNALDKTYSSQRLVISRQLHSRKRQLKGATVKWAPENVPAEHAFDPSLHRLWKPLAFTIGLTGASFIGASVWQYETMLVLAERLKNQSWPHHHSNSTHIIDYNNTNKRGAWRQAMNQVWALLPEGREVAVSLIGLNLLVFAAWRIPRLQPTMMRYFSCNPAAKVVCWPMLLSTFSHYSTFHLFCNMYVLWNFSAPVINLMGKEQFLAFYLSAGVVASFGSLIYKTLFLANTYSLGASGAILGVIGVACCHHPDAMLSILFLPMFPFTADSALKGIIAFDALGLLLRWKVFDHAAHLGGALFGIWYVNYGHKYLWDRREPVMSAWHRIRTNILGPPS